MDKYVNAEGLEQPRLDLSEAKSALRALRLETVSIDDYLVVVRSEFDSSIGGEPHIALMLLYNIKMGVFMARDDYTPVCFSTCDMIVVKPHPQGTRPYMNYGSFFCSSGLLRRCLLIPIDGVVGVSFQCLII